LIKPLVSVIIPIYNQEPYLRQCMNSVLSQTLENIEIIAINDGSTDASLDIITEYIKRDERVRLINQENMGVASARNNGINVANGQFVAFMDPDDWYPENDILQVMYQTAIDKNVKIVGGSLSRWLDGQATYEHDRWEKTNADYMFTEDKLLYYRDYQFDYGFWRFLYQLDMLRVNGIKFPPYQRFQDPPFFCEAMICASEFYALKKITYMYRVEKKQINWTDRKVCDTISGMLDLLELSKKHKLEKLHFIAFYRLNTKYLGDIVSESLKNGNRNLLLLLAKANNAIDIALLLDAKSKIHKETWKIMDGFSQSDIVWIKSLFLLNLQSRPEQLEQRLQQIEQEKQHIEEQIQMLQSGHGNIIYTIRHSIKHFFYILNRGFKCLKDHGLRYTVKHIFKSIKELTK